jgi:hypothetical protein
MVKMDKRYILSSAALIAALGWNGLALAQSTQGALAAADSGGSNFARDRNSSVRQRPRQGYEALGLRLGAFMAYPQITAAVEHNSNVYASNTRTLDDTIVRIQPSLNVTSTWSRHVLSAYVLGSLNRYNDFKTENSDEYGAGAAGRIDILSSANVSGGVDVAKAIEPRTSSSSPIASVKPIEFVTDAANVAAVREFNRLKVSGRADWKKFNYKDGRDAASVVVEQDDRDRTTTSATARADYSVSPDTALFFQATANKRDYRLGRPAVTAKRDSDGYEVLGGANFEISALTRGEVGVGYISQSYDDPRFKDINGFGARAQVEWFPSQLTTVSLTGARTVEDSGITGVSGYLSSNISAQVDHELLRNVILSAQASYGDDEYKGIAREDKRTTVGVSGTYLLNHNVGLTASYNHFDQDSTRAASNFKVDKVMVGLTLQF